MSASMLCISVGLFVARQAAVIVVSPLSLSLLTSMYNPVLKFSSPWTDTDQADGSVVSGTGI